jgi:hypothetical protein
MPMRALARALVAWLALAASAAWAGAISVESGGFQFIPGLTLTNSAGNIITTPSGNFSVSAAGVMLIGGMGLNSGGTAIISSATTISIQSGGGGSGTALKVGPNAGSITSGSAIQVYSDSGLSTLIASIDFNGNFKSASTTGSQFACTGAAACTLNAASGQNINFTTAGGGVVEVNGTPIATSADWSLSFPYLNTSDTGGIGQVTTTSAGTFRSMNWITQTAGVGAGNFVLKLCSDGISCATGNTFTTCTVACTGFGVTACTPGAKTTYAAATTITFSVQTQCTTTNQIGFGLADLTTP